MNICVFCGSSFGTEKIYEETARSLGHLLGRSSFTLVYGGGNVGLMGVLADAVMASSGKVVGVIPEFLLRKEVGHRGITQLEIVESMHERKKRMADLADAFVAMPGGWGTLEELAEILTWKQLGLIHQPVIVLNCNGFFDPLLHQMQRMVREGFLRPENLEQLRIETSPESVLASLLPQNG